MSDSLVSGCWWLVVVAAAWWHGGDAARASRANRVVPTARDSAATASHAGVRASRVKESVRRNSETGSEKKGKTSQSSGDATRRYHRSHFRSNRRCRRLVKANSLPPLAARPPPASMSTMKFPHPFLHGLKPAPAGHDDDLQQIKEWLKSQPHLPWISDEYIYLFLHSNYWRLQHTKDTIEAYFTLRSGTPDIFTGRDPLAPKNKTVLDITQMVALPLLTPERHHVLVYRLADLDYSKLCFADAVRVFCMFNDVKLSEDGLSEGYVVVFDMKGCSLGHLTRVTLPALRAFMQYIQNAHPARLKKIHVVHTVSFINQVMCLVKPLIHSNLLNLLHFSSEGPQSVIDLDLLPEDYGGSQPPMKTLHEQQRKNMEENYADWLVDSENFKVDDKKRIKKPNKGVFANLTGSFKTLEID